MDYARLIKEIRGKNPAKRQFATGELLMEMRPMLAGAVGKYKIKGWTHDQLLQQAEAVVIRKAVRDFNLKLSSSTLFPRFALLVVRRCLATILKYKVEPPVCAVDATLYCLDYQL